MANDDSIDLKLTANDTALQATMAKVLDTMKGLQKSINGVGDAAKAMLTTGIAGYSIYNFIRAAEEEEESVHHLHLAMEANGADMQVWGDHIDGLVDQLQRLTTHSDDALRSFMTMALNRGVVVQDLENMTKAAIGLSRITGMGLSTSLRQLMMAQEGAFGAFNRALPAIRSLHSDKEKLAFINDKVAKGWEQEQKAMDSALGMQRKLMQSINDLKEDLGQALLPGLLQFAQNARTLVLVIRDWVGAHEQLVGTIIKLSFYTLSAVVLIPKLVTGLVWLGTTMLWLVTSPIGLLITGLGALTVLWLSVLGVGNTFWERMVDGAKKAIDWLDILLGSWKNLTQGVGDLWDIVVARFKQAWEGAYNFLKNNFIEVKAWLGNLWDTIGEQIVETVGYHVTLAAIETKRQTRMFSEGLLSGLIAGATGGLVTRDDQAKIDEVNREFDVMRGLATKGHQEKMLGMSKETPEKVAARNALAAGDLEEEQKRHDQAVKDNQKAVEDAEKKFRDNTKEREKREFGLPGKEPARLSKNIKNVMDQLGLGDLWQQSQDAVAELRKVVAGGAGEGPNPLELSAGAGKNYKASFEDADSSYKRMATFFASGENDPMQKLADNAKQQLDLQRIQQEKTAKAVEVFTKKFEEVIKKLGGNIVQLLPPLK